MSSMIFNKYRPTVASLTTLMTNQHPKKTQKSSAHIHILSRVCVYSMCLMIGMRQSSDASGESE